jgi:predicted nucleic acid-binding protein
VIYLDSSALVKLAVVETESAALHRFLRGHAHRVSCALARVELPRAVRRHGRGTTSTVAQVFAGTRFIPVDDALLDDAAAIKPLRLRSLDAIHLAAAQTLGDELEALVTYDTRMAAAARAVGIEVRAPA